MTGTDVSILLDKLADVYEREGDAELSAVVGNLCYTEKHSLLVCTAIRRSIERARA